MNEVLAKLIEIVPHYAAAVLVAGLVLLGLPSDWISALGLAAWWGEYRPWTVAMTILAGALVLVRIGSAIWGAVGRSVQRRRAASVAARQKIAILESLDTLSDEETQILMYMLYRHQTTVAAPLVNQFTHSLTSKGLLRRGSGSGNMMSWPFTIPPFVWEELQRRREKFLPDELVNRPNIDREMEQAIRSLLAF